MCSNLDNANAPSAKKRKVSAPEPAQISHALDTQITGMLGLMYVSSKADDIFKFLGTSSTYYTEATEQSCKRIYNDGYSLKYTRPHTVSQSHVHVHTHSSTLLHAHTLQLSSIFKT